MKLTICMLEPFTGAGAGPDADAGGGPVAAADAGGGTGACTAVALAVATGGGGIATGALFVALLLFVALPMFDTRLCEHTPHKPWYLGSVVLHHKSSSEVPRYSNHVPCGSAMKDWRNLLRFSPRKLRNRHFRSCC